MKPLVNQIDISTQFNIEWFFYSVSAPSFETDLLFIPGRNGYIDLSRTNGQFRTYQDRDIVLKYGMRNLDMQSWIETSSNLLKAFHGQEVKLQLEPNYFYIGTCNITADEPTNNRRAIFELNFTCQPFKFKDELTTLALPSTAVGQEHTVNNLFAPSRPTIKAVGNDSSVKFENKIYGLNLGDNYYPEINFVGGDNLITCIGADPITFTWQEGEL